MRTLTNIILLLASSLALFAAGCTAPRTEQIRPVTVEVLDDETGRPLPDIRVVQAIRSDVYGDPPFGMIPNMEVRKSHYIFEVLNTGSDGTVRFARKKVRLGWNEHLNDETIIVNMDIDDHYDRLFENDGHYDRIFKKEENVRLRALVHFGASTSYKPGHVFSPAPGLKGAVIFSSEYAYSSEYWSGETEDFSIILNDEGLLRDPDHIEVRLKKRE